MRLAGGAPRGARDAPAAASGARRAALLVGAGVLLLPLWGALFRRAPCAPSAGAGAAALRAPVPLLPAPGGDPDACDPGLRARPPVRPDPACPRFLVQRYNHGPGFGNHFGEFAVSAALAADVGAALVVDDAYWSRRPGEHGSYELTRRLLHLFDFLSLSELDALRLPNLTRTEAKRRAALYEAFGVDPPPDARPGGSGGGGAGGAGAFAAAKAAASASAAIAAAAAARPSAAARPILPAGPGKVPGDPSRCWLAVTVQSSEDGFCDGAICIVAWPGIFARAAPLFRALWRPEPALALVADYFGPARARPGGARVVAWHVRSGDISLHAGNAPFFAGVRAALDAAAAVAGGPPLVHYFLTGDHNAAPSVSSTPFKGYEFLGAAVPGATYVTSNRWDADFAAMAAADVLVGSGSSFPIAAAAVAPPRLVWLEPPPKEWPRLPLAPATYALPGAIPVGGDGSLAPAAAAELAARLAAQLPPGAPPPPGCPP